MDVEVDTKLLTQKNNFSSFIHFKLVLHILVGIKIERVVKEMKIQLHDNKFLKSIALNMKIDTA